MSRRCWISSERVAVEEVLDEEGREEMSNRSSDSVLFSEGSRSSEKGESSRMVFLRFLSTVL